MTAVEWKEKKKPGKEHPTSPHLQTSNHLGSGRGQRRDRNGEKGIPSGTTRGQLVLEIQESGILGME